MREMQGILALRDNLSSGGRNGYLETVAVNPNFQGRGIGTEREKKSSLI